MIEYFRLTIHKDAEVYQYRAAYQESGIYLDYFGTAPTFIDCFQLASLMFLKKRYFKKRLKADDLLCLKKVVEGDSYDQIARSIGKVNSSVSYHLRQVQDALGTVSIPQTIFVATVLGYLQPFEPSGWHPDWIK